MITPKQILEHKTSIVLNEEEKIKADEVEKIFDNSIRASFSGGKACVTQQTLRMCISNAYNFDYYRRQAILNNVLKRYEDYWQIERKNGHIYFKEKISLTQEDIDRMNEKPDYFA